MRKAQFNVPSEVMVAFVEELTSRDVKSSITGTTEDDEIIIEVEYERDEADQVDELEEALDELCSQLGEPEEDE